MSVERWLPTGPASCVLILDFCFAGTGSDAEARNQVDIAASSVICEEDKAICEAVQRNLEAGVYDAGLLSPRPRGGRRRLPPARPCRTARFLLSAWRSNGAARSGT